MTEKEAIGFIDDLINRNIHIFIGKDYQLNKIYVSISPIAAGNGDTFLEACTDLNTKLKEKGFYND